MPNDHERREPDEPTPSGTRGTIPARVAALKARELIRKAEYRRRVFLLAYEGSIAERYEPTGLSCRERPVVPKPHGDLDLDDVLEDVVARYRSDTGEESDPGDLADRGLGSRDLTVWRDGRLLAAIRRGDDGGPVITRFDR